MILAQAYPPYLPFIFKFLVMSALEAKEKLSYNATKRNARLVVMEQSKNPQQSRLEKPKKPTIDSLTDQRLGLPPQPTEYIKYPDYDWF